MKTVVILALATLGLAACHPATAPVTNAATGVAPSGGTAGAMGEAYCETPPANPDDMTQWTELCQPGGR